MRWLWAVAPFIVLCTAVGLSIPVRGLARMRSGLAEEHRGATTDQYRSLRRDLAGMRREIAALGHDRSHDSDAGTSDR
jgi:hypothetical protein